MSDVIVVRVFPRFPSRPHRREKGKRWKPEQITEIVGTVGPWIVGVGDEKL